MILSQKEVEREINDPKKLQYILLVKYSSVCKVVVFTDVADEQEMCSRMERKYRIRFGST